MDNYKEKYFGLHCKYAKQDDAGLWCTRLVTFCRTNCENCGLRTQTELDLDWKPFIDNLNRSIGD